MAGLNVAEWTPDDVANWLSGLGEKIAPYVEPLRQRGFHGQRLLILRCDDLEYLGVHVIGHQEIILEAVEHLRNFHYETKRECIQQLALRVAVVGGGLARALAVQSEPRLATSALADVATLVKAVKPLAWWLDRCGSAALAGRRAALLHSALEAATCAQRDRFAEAPARAVGAAAAAAAGAADALVAGAADPALLTPAALDCVRLQQGARPLGFRVRAAPAGHTHLADIRFGSPAHATPRLREGDEIVQVGAQVVVGWTCARVTEACGAEAAARGDLLLRVRRRPPAPPPPPPARHAAPRSPAVPRAASPAEPSSDDSEPAAPPPSRIFPPKPRMTVQRRHTISGGSPFSKRPSLGIEQLWAELKEQHWAMGGSGLQVDNEDTTLYRRDKAVSYSTGLELPPRARPRPRTVLGSTHAPPSPPPQTGRRGLLDKSHSTPAYDLDHTDPADLADPASLLDQTIPESPTTPTHSPTIHIHSAEKADAILDFKKSSTQIAEAILQRSRRDTLNLATDDEANDIVETINDLILDCHNTELSTSVISSRSDASDKIRLFSEASDKVKLHSDANDKVKLKSETSDKVRLHSDASDKVRLHIVEKYRPVGNVIANSVLRPVPRTPEEQPRTLRLDSSQISLPLKHITKQDIQMIGSIAGTLPPLNPPPPPPSPPRVPSAPPAASPPAAPSTPATPGGVVRAIFPTSKTKSLKKKNSILAKRRQIDLCSLEASLGGCGGVAWQRVRGGGGAGGGGGARWARRRLLLVHTLLYAYKHAASTKAECMIMVSGFTVCAADEVRSRPHAFKVYHTGRAFYFSTASQDATRAWISHIHRATMLPPLQPPMEISMQYSETDYSETESDPENSDHQPEPIKTDLKEKDKSKFGSLKKLTNRMQRSESQENVSHASTSLDRKYLRFFSRHRSKDDSKTVAKCKPSPPAAPPTHTSHPDLLLPSPASPASPPASRSPRSPRSMTSPAGGAGGAARKPELAGLLTLEEFMLRKQDEEKAQVYGNRVVLGVEGGVTSHSHTHAHSHTPSHTQAYPHTPAPPASHTTHTHTHRADPHTHGLRSDKCSSESSRAADLWRKDSLRRNDKVHSSSPPLSARLTSPTSPTSPDVGGIEAGGVSRLRLMFSARAPTTVQSPQYPHLQCPPTFQPETYSLAKLAPRRHRH